MKTRFEKPSIGDISQYLTDVKNYDEFTADGFADQFWHYYESNGWKVGKVPMKDWKAALRTWEINKKKYASHQQTVKQPIVRKSAGAETLLNSLKADIAGLGS